MLVFPFVQQLWKRMMSWKRTMPWKRMRGIMTRRMEAKVLRQGLRRIRPCRVLASHLRHMHH